MKRAFERSAYAGRVLFVECARCKARVFKRCRTATTGDYALRPHAVRKKAAASPEADIPMGLFVRVFGGPRRKAHPKRVER